MMKLFELWRCCSFNPFLVLTLLKIPKELDGCESLVLPKGNLVCVGWGDSLGQDIALRR